MFYKHAGGKCGPSPFPRPAGWGTQPLRIQLRLLTFQFSCLPYPGATCRLSGGKCGRIGGAVSIVGERFPRPMGWGTQPLRIQLRLLTFQFSCLPYPGATCRLSGALVTGRHRPSINMPPLWGFKTFVCRACYKHAAPLGLKQTPVGRDSYLDADMSILENRPTTGLIQTISSASSCVSALSSITYHASRFISPETAASASP